jgi:hypothetical protein
MTSRNYKEGEHIIRQGEEGRDFFLILAGDVACTVSAKGEAGWNSTSLLVHIHVKNCLAT